MGIYIYLYTYKSFDSHNNQFPSLSTEPFVIAAMAMAVVSFGSPMAITTKLPSQRLALWPGNGRQRSLRYIRTMGKYTIHGGSFKVFFFRWKGGGGVFFPQEIWIYWGGYGGWLKVYLPRFAWNNWECWRFQVFFSARFWWGRNVSSKGSFAQWSWLSWSFPACFTSQILWGRHEWPTHSTK